MKHDMFDVNVKPNIAKEIREVFAILYVGNALFQKLQQTSLCFNSLCAVYFKELSN